MKTTPAPATSAPNDDLDDSQRAIWRLGDYAAVARDVVGGLGPDLVQACEIAEGQRVLDVAAGAGNAAIPAAETGAEVIALDLTPELFDAGRAEARRRGVEVEWLEGDAQELPFESERFDVVISCIGAMFAPDHEATARELARVCRPGGSVGMITWPPDGSVAGFFKTFSAYAPPPPEGFRPPTLWGSEDYVRNLFGDQLERWTVARKRLVVDNFATPQEWCDYYKANFGPTIATYAAIADDPVLTARLDSDFLAFATDYNLSDRPNHTLYHLEYMLFTARKPLRSGE